MNDRRLLRYFSFALFFLASAGIAEGTALASPPMPTPICNVSGAIISATFIKASVEPCVNEPYGCPTDMQTNHPARYELDVKISSVKYASGATDFTKCEDMYQVGSEQTIYITKDDVKNNDQFSAGQIIEGEVRSFWGYSFESYHLTHSDIKDPEKPGDNKPETKNTLTSDVVSQKIRDVGLVEKVIDIALGQDGQTYTITAEKSAKLFFFIPISLQVLITADASTGDVKETKMPWWAFLTDY